MSVYHFIGIKGTGMSALAQILHDSGKQVQGSDIDQEIFTQKALEKRDITILPFSEDNIEKIKSLLQVMHLAMIMKKLRKQKS